MSSRVMACLLQHGLGELEYALPDLQRCEDIKQLSELLKSLGVRKIGARLAVASVLLCEQTEVALPEPTSNDSFDAPLVAGPTRSQPMYEQAATSSTGAPASAPLAVAGHSSSSESVLAALKPGALRPLDGSATDLSSWPAVYEVVHDPMVMIRDAPSTRATKIGGERRGALVFGSGEVDGWVRRWPHADPRFAGYMLIDGSNGRGQPATGHTCIHAHTNTTCGCSAAALDCSFRRLANAGGWSFPIIWQVRARPRTAAPPRGSAVGPAGGLFAASRCRAHAAEHWHRRSSFSSVSRLPAYVTRVEARRAAGGAACDAAAVGHGQQQRSCAPGRPHDRGQWVRRVYGRAGCLTWGLNPRHA